MSEFKSLSEFYDSFSDDSYYENYHNFIVKAFRDYPSIEIKEVLDLGCGTGQLSKRLHEDGYDMVCVDISTEMLNKAREKCVDLLLLNQDMVSFELYGTVQATICTLDSLNYLKSEDELRQTFLNIANYTEKGGLFIFDINTKYRYEEVYGTNSFVFENDDGILIWRNSPEDLGYHIIDITLFIKEDDGSYIRFDESQRQILFETQTIDLLLKQTGFEVLGRFSSLNYETNLENNEKVYFIAQRI